MPVPSRFHLRLARADESLQWRRPASAAGRRRDEWRRRWSYRVIGKSDNRKYEVRRTIDEGTENQDPSTRVSRAGSNAREPSLTQDDSFFLLRTSYFVLRTSRISRLFGRRRAPDGRGRRDPASRR